MPTIDRDGVVISYRDAGSGTPVVLLHSSASSGGQWQSLNRLIVEHVASLATRDTGGARMRAA